MEHSIDREKVIKAAEICLRYIDDEDCPKECPYFDLCTKYEKRIVFQPLIRDALSLLKEQEAKPMIENEIGWNCPSCGMNLIGKTASGYPCDLIDLPEDEPIHFCPKCGQAVK